MKKMALALSAVTGWAAATVAMAPPATAVRSAPVSAGETVHMLEASGFEVIVGQVGAAPLSQRCFLIEPAGSGHKLRAPVIQFLPSWCR